MKLVALLPVRNEEYCLGLTLRALLMWVDAVVVLLHACTDGTAEIVEQVIREHDRGRVHVLRFNDPTWFEMQHRQQMLTEARHTGATHIAYVDADEVLSGNLVEHMTNPGFGVDQIPRGGILQLPWVCLARSIDSYYCSGPWYNAWVSTAFQDSPELHWTARDGYDFHQREPLGRKLTAYRPIAQSPHPAQHQGGLMHLQFISERRLRAKQALYKMVEVTRWPGRDPTQTINARYNLAVYQSDPAKVATAEVPATWWAPYAHLMKHLDLDAVPWQESECRRMMAQHGVERFRGLDLFGVV